MEIILSGATGIIQSFSVSNLDDNDINDIDDVFIGQIINGVTNIEFRITENELFRDVEIREFFVSGNVSLVPEPAVVWLCGSGLIGLFGMRKKSSKLSIKYA